MHHPIVPAANERGARALERLCERVGAFRTRSLVGEDFEDVERELHAQFVETEREVLGELLESLERGRARRGRSTSADTTGCSTAPRAIPRRWGQ